MLRRATLHDDADNLLKNFLNALQNFRERMFRQFVHIRQRPARRQPRFFEER